uniref:Uncharacterized protein n=1 Tax=Timema douglasi TaxID=61478 RepID=A0A7R8VSW5_TIMDO|nr:unnamed protein product [Timema douglasi]
MSWMFPECSIANAFTLGGDKAAYYIVFGLAAFFHNNLQDRLKSCNNFVICFAEALNQVIQRGQMDIVIRFWDKENDQVEHIKSVTDNEVCNLLNLGPCGLHVVHGSLRTGLESVDWDISSLLCHMYYLFTDSSSPSIVYPVDRMCIFSIEVLWCAVARFATKPLLEETAITVTEIQKPEFIHECRSMLTTMIAKLQERSPLKQKSSLDPCVFQHSPQLGQKRFSFLLEELNHANIINDVLAENAKKEYLHFYNLKNLSFKKYFVLNEMEHIPVHFLLRGDNEIQDIPVHFLLRSDDETHGLEDITKSEQTLILGGTNTNSTEGLKIDISVKQKLISDKSNFIEVEKAASIFDTIKYQWTMAELIDIVGGTCSVLKTFPWEKTTASISQVLGVGAALLICLLNSWTMFICWSK